MNAEIKKAWVEALRSGRYKQGRGRLRDGDEFCCLGVLCDLGERKAWQTDGSYKAPDGSYRNRSLPGQILQAAGLTEEAHGTLWRLNDGVGFVAGNEKHSFEEIADWIEENL